MLLVLRGIVDDDDGLKTLCWLILSGSVQLVLIMERDCRVINQNCLGK